MVRVSTCREILVGGSVVDIFRPRYTLAPPTPTFPNPENHSRLLKDLTGLEHHVRPVDKEPS